MMLTTPAIASEPYSGDAPDCSTSTRSIMFAGIVLRSTVAGNAAAAGAVDEAQAVDQHQRALGAEIAQVDLGRTGADAAAVGRIAEVAGIVDLGVQATAGAGQTLQDVGDRGQAGPGERRLIDDDDGARFVQADRDGCANR